ncbi:MAG: hydantoinase B/oxoprolinase family protein [Cyanobacteriota bacterium]|nr:hydantoinase B/oxoprolinase family protein [Cyanobacteriota bacterium]
MDAPRAASGGWRFWIDRGGTFTDLVGVDPAGCLHVRKVLSEQPDRPGDPAVAAMAAALGLEPGQPIPAERLAEVRLGTTVVTNALLESRGEPVLLLVNQGFADLVQIGDQQRPDLFALAIERPALPRHRVLEVEGRLDATGRERLPLRLDDRLADAVREARAAGYTATAVVLLHAWRQPSHELALANWLEQLGCQYVQLSHRVSGQPRVVRRLHTTLVEAALGPVLRTYLQQLRGALGPGPQLRVMASSGALRPPDQLQAIDTILSGPAGGMVGAMAAARQVDPGAPVLGFDMGGTSTDVFHAAADPEADGSTWERSSEAVVAGLRLHTTMLPIHTVAAGGGSVLSLEEGRLQVGPRSAGADPGPACYRRGGPLTITDANLLLGRLPVEALPAVFGTDGRQGADSAAVRQGFSQLAARAGAASAEQLAAGALTIAVERMADAIRQLSIQRGHDIRRALLVAYGGAAGQLVCPVAERLGLDRVLLHPLAGVLSAFGIGQARQRWLRQEAVRRPLTHETLAALRQRCRQLEAEGCGQLLAAGGPEVLVALELREPGRDQGLVVSWHPEESGAEPCRLQAAFAALYRQRFGHASSDEPLVVERLLVELVMAAEPPPSPPHPVATGPAVRQGRLWLEDRWHTVPIHQRAGLAPGERLTGPAVVLDPTGTLVLERHWSAEVLATGALLLRHQPPVGARPGSGGTQAADAVLLELYNHRFAAIAEQMGERLQQSSRSVNIRERLDFSCAVFDGEGRLVANAPHIPVHLGSMGDSVAALLAAVARGQRPALAPGDAIAANNPYNGGTHLPDITVISPVFAGGDRPLAFVASRGHHADVGGITPGSMPPFSRTITEEGLLLDNAALLQAGQFNRTGWLERLGAGPQPVRQPAQLVADLLAQAAANQLGVQALERLIQLEGAAEVASWMDRVRANAATAVRHWIQTLQDGAYSVELDNGARIAVALRVERDRGRLTIDFSGTSAQDSGNLNAPLAITRAAVLYVLRTQVGRPIPLNAGCFEPIALVVPEGSLLRPRFPAAVVAGNVETSQAITQALLAALGVMAASQGTMNNLSFGNGQVQYYETIGGGSGAGLRADGSGFAGCSGVQTHMTNSRLTDPEILEDRFPVRLEHFGFRRGSGGPGLWRGGDGLVRQIRILEPMTVALVAGSRRVAPFGLAGGGAGACGRNLLLGTDGGEELLPGSFERELAAGEGLRIETPGGGAWGEEAALPC